MPKLIEYFQPVKDYFTKNYGINTVTAVALPLVVQTVAVGNPAVAATMASALAAVDPTSLDTIMHGGAGGITAAVMLLARIGLMFANRK